MKKFIAMFAIEAESMDGAMDAARAACVRRDLTIMEADDRDDIRTLAEAIVLPGARAEPSRMTWSTDVECAGWVVRIEWSQRSELGAVSFLRKEAGALKTEACMVLPAPRMHELMLGLAVFPADLIARCAESGAGRADSH